MKKTVLCCAFLLSIPCLGWAQPPQEQNQVTLKEVTITQIFEYGRTLYERNDYMEAGNVFRHILALSPGHAGALEYLRRMNEPGPQPLVWQDTTIPAVTTDFPEPNADLKKAIAVETNAINHTDRDLKKLRSTTKAYEK